MLIDIFAVKSKMLLLFLIITAVISIEGASIEDKVSEIFSQKLNVNEFLNLLLKN